MCRVNDVNYVVQLSPRSRLQIVHVNKLKDCGEFEPIAIEVFALLVESGTSAFTAVELFNCAVTFRGALDPVISSSNLNVMRT